MIYLKNSIRNIFCLVLAQSEGRAIFKNALFSKAIVKYKIFFEFIRVSTILIFLVCSIIFAYFSKPKPPCFLVPCPRSVPLLILNMLRYTLIDTFKIMSFHFEKKNECLWDPGLVSTQPETSTTWSSSWRQSPDTRHSLVKNLPEIDLEMCRPNCDTLN